MAMGDSHINSCKIDNRRPEEAMWAPQEKERKNLEHVENCPNRSTWDNNSPKDQWLREDSLVTKQRGKYRACLAKDCQ